jgi:hypothetical protein
VDRWHLPPGDGPDFSCSGVDASRTVQKAPKAGTITESRQEEKLSQLSVFDNLFVEHEFCDVVHSFSCHRAPRESGSAQVLYISPPSPRAAVAHWRISVCTLEPAVMSLKAGHFCDAATFVQLLTSAWHGQP